MKAKQDRQSSSKYRLVQFQASLDEIISSIINQSVIEGVDIANEVQDPNFRFISLIKNERRDSLKMSEAFAVLSKLIKTRDTRAAVEKSIEKRVEDADEFALKMYPIIQDLRAETGIITNKGTVKLLNERNIPTYSEAGEWHPSTLNNLKKRWKELGVLN